MNAIDNFLPKKYNEELTTLICGRQFPWFYHETMSYYGNSEKPNILNDKNIKESSQFVHFFYIANDGNPYSSDYWQLLIPMFYIFSEKTGIEYKKIIRCKANLVFKEEGFKLGQYNYPHVDVESYNDKEYISAVYYLIDYDGPTYIFNKDLKDNISGNLESLNVTETSEIEKNRLIYFDSYKYHASSNPINNSRRIVINLLMEI